MSERKVLCILFGGKSVEHEISIRSAANVCRQVDPDLYEVELIGIDKSGKWHLCEKVDQPIADGLPVRLDLDAGKPLFIASGRLLRPDIVFPVLHGTDGEDGSIQGLIKVLNIPLVGSGVLGSAVSMDKIISKMLLRSAGIPVADSLAYHVSEKHSIEYNFIAERLDVPFMIKSAALGSSVGVSKVVDEASFIPALNESFQYDNRIIIEQFVEGREMECAVIGNAAPIASMPGEIVMVKDYGFYTYKAKYLDEQAINIKIPAEVDGEISDRIRKLSIAAYKALRCEDFARVDLFLTPAGEVFINEINSIPGFTDVSMFPMLWKNMGLSYTELISRLIVYAEERWEQTMRLETSYINKE
jgi:D-alanine-D-alanine ligase